MKSIRYATLLLLATTSVVGQKTTAPSTKGTVSGRVFLVDKNGDLKVARLAHVYFLYNGSLKQGEAINTAAGKFLSVLVSEEQALSDQSAKSNAWNPSAAAILRMYSPPNDATDAEEQQMCLKRRLGYVTALDQTSQWVDENKKPKQLQSTDTDEEGAFVVNLPAGIYEIVATGQAGGNEAIWTKENVILPPRQTIPVKLASPEVSCVIEN